MRHRRFVVWVMIIGVAVGALPSTAAPTAATWGGVKRLYTGAAEFELGPGVSASEASRALTCAIVEGGARFEGTVQVALVGRSSEGKVLAVMGPGAAGTADAHLVTESGIYLGGATVDPAAGTIRDIVTGGLLLSDEGLRTLDPAGVTSTLGGILVDIGQAICSTVINPVIDTVVSKLLGTGDMDLKTIIYLALCAVILTLCQRLTDIHMEQVPSLDG